MSTAQQPTNGPFAVAHDGSVAVVTLDIPGQPLNTLSTSLAASFGTVLDDIARSGASLASRAV